MSASCSQRLLSLWLRRLSTDRIVRLREVSSPLAIYGKRGNAELTVAVDEAAERLGLHTGLALAQARAMHPALEAIAEDAEADAGLLEKIADWCLRYTPLVALDAPDGLTLDIGGCAHLYGGEHQLVADLGARIAQAGFTYDIAIAGTIGAARAAAHFGAPGSYTGGEERALLAPLPLSALRRWRASALSASATSSICRAAPSPPASVASSYVSSTVR
jgi:protein ImuB